MASYLNGPKGGTLKMEYVIAFIAGGLICVIGQALA